MDDAKNPFPVELDNLVRRKSNYFWYKKLCVLSTECSLKDSLLHENIRIVKMHNDKPTEVMLMLVIWWQDEDYQLDNLDVTQLDITSQEDYILDEAAGNVY